MATAESFKIAVALALQQGVSFDELSNGMHGIPPEPSPTKNLESLIVNNGIITAMSTKMAGDATLILIPDSYGDNWSISGTCLETGLCSS